MIRWKNKNKEFRKALDEEEIEEALMPFRAQLQRLAEENKGVKGYSVKVAYRETRAVLLEELRINFALLDAAAYEENILIKK